MSGFLPGFLLAIAPLLLLVALLVRGTYPGEGTLARFRRIVSMLLSRAVRDPAPAVSLTGPERLSPRCFIGCSMSGRGPPLLVSVFSTRRDVKSAVVTAGKEAEMRKTRSIIIALATLFAFAFPVAAQAHVTVSPEEAAADGYAMLTFTVPHGCEEAATNRLEIRMPDQVISATPGVVAGWNLKTVEGKLPQPAEMHGEQVTEGVRTVIWTGGPLPHDQLQQFPLSVAFAGTDGEPAEFKVLQGCVNGTETAWIQSTPASGEEPPNPAPAVHLTASEDQHAHDSDREETAVESQSDDSGDTLAIAALIVGGLGLLTGVAALFRARRK